MGLRCPHAIVTRDALAQGARAGDRVRGSPLRASEPGRSRGDARADRPRPRSWLGSPPGRRPLARRDTERQRAHGWIDQFGRRATRALQRALEPHVDTLLSLGIADFRPAVLIERLDDAFEAARRTAPARASTGSMELRAPEARDRGVGRRARGPSRATEPRSQRPAPLERPGRSHGCRRPFASTTGATASSSIRSRQPRSPSGSSSAKALGRSIAPSTRIWSPSQSWARGRSWWRRSNWQAALRESHGRSRGLGRRLRRDRRAFRARSI